MHAFISLYVCIHLLYPCHMYLLRFNKNVTMKSSNNIFQFIIQQMLLLKLCNIEWDIVEFCHPHPSHYNIFRLHHLHMQQSTSLFIFSQYVATVSN